MANLQTLYRFVLHLASCLLVVGLVLLISPVLAESVNEPSSKGLSPCEEGKEEIIKALGEEGGEIDCSGCIVVGDLEFFNLPEEAETGKYLFSLSRYLFSWDNVPGNDSKLLRRFLWYDLNIGWAKNAEIHKSDDGKTIRIFKGGNSAEIMIDEKNKRATLNIRDGRTHDLKVKKKNGKLNIYSSHYMEHLKNGSVNDTLIQAFDKKKVFLSSKANITQEDNKNWKIEDGGKIYKIKDLGTHLKVYTGVIIIKRPLKFRGTVFKGKIRTCSGPSREIKEKPPVKFSSKIDFNGASFEDVVRFDGALFKENSYFSDAHFHKMVFIREATFYKNTSFYSTQFDEEALFQKTTFRDKANFEFATFNGLAFFLETKFRYSKSEYGADFLFTRFKGVTSFVKAQFNSTARFIGTTFHGPSYFAESRFKDQAWFAGGCRFDDDVTFKGAKFFFTDKNKLPRAPVIFNGVVFSGDADFSDVHFGHVAFCEVGGYDIGIATTFKKKADFRRATFENLDLHRVIFKSNVDFSRAKLGEKMDFTDVDIESASIRLECDQFLRKNGTPKFEWQGVFKNGQYIVKDDQTRTDCFDFLALLKRNFEEHGQLKDAGKVHYLVEDCKRKDRNRFFGSLDWIFLKCIYGYGVKWRRYVVVSILAIFVFALLYKRRNVLQHDKSREKKLRLCINGIPTDLDKLHGKRKKIGIKSYCIDKEKKVQAYSATKITKLKSFSCRFWYGFWLSVYVFTKIGYGDVYVKNEYKWTRYAVAIEWFLGYFLGVLLFLNLISRCEPLSRLVTTFI